MSSILIFINRGFVHHYFSKHQFFAQQCSPWTEFIEWYLFNFFAMSMRNCILCHQVSFLLVILRTLLYCYYYKSIISKYYTHAVFDVFTKESRLQNTNIIASTGASFQFLKFLKTIEKQRFAWYAYSFCITSSSWIYWQALQTSQKIRREIESRRSF